jgi:hypothetical protein
MKKYTFVVTDQYPNGPNSPSDVRTRFKCHLQEAPATWEVGTSRAEVVGRMLSSVIALDSQFPVKIVE